MLNIKPILILSFLVIVKLTFAQSDTNELIGNRSPDYVLTGGADGYNFFISSCFDIKPNYHDTKYNIFKIKYENYYTIRKYLPERNITPHHIVSLGVLTCKSDLSYCLLVGESFPFCEDNLYPLFDFFLFNTSLGYNTNFKNSSFVFVPEIGFNHNFIGQFIFHRKNFLNFNFLFGLNIPFSRNDYLYLRTFSPYISIEICIKSKGIIWDSYFKKHKKK